MYRNYIRRLLDMICVLLGLTILSPLLLVVIVVMSFANKGTGVFFSQTRPGRGERLFNMYKFKSMTDKRNIASNLLPDVQRLTAMGRFIRRTSIGELPRLWNILHGGMSLVSLRPFLVAYRHIPMKRKKVDIINVSIEGDSIATTPAQCVRCQMRPGITGLAQINGRSKLSYQHRFAYDAQYMYHLSFALDLKILLRTATQTLQVEDISSATNEPGDYLQEHTARLQQESVRLRLHHDAVTFDTTDVRPSVPACRYM